MSVDAQLQKAVLAELKWEPSVKAGHIGVAADNGVVTLTGHVEHYAQKRAAAEAARRVKGVKAVAEEIEVRLPSELALHDDAIASAAIHRLQSNIHVPKDAIKIDVEKGWVSLRGTVDWNFQREAAAQDVRMVHGVRGVSNLITIKPQVDVSAIADDITHALHRSWFFDPQTIRVKADEGKVRLSGTVRSPNEMRVAARTAWAAPGVIDVVNDLVVA